MPPLQAQTQTQTRLLLLVTAFRLIIIFTFHHQAAATQSMLVNTTCIAGNYTADDPYATNLSQALSRLITDATTNNATYSNVTVDGGDIGKVYSLYYCTGEIGISNCGACVTAAVTAVLKECPTSREAIVWYLECTLRYANRNFFSVMEVSPMSYLTNRNKTVSDGVAFETTFPSTTVELSLQASATRTSNPPMYAYREVPLSSSEKLSMLMQCSSDLNNTNCMDCLSSAFSSLSSCCKTHSIFNVVFLPSCLFMYVVDNPSNGSTPSTSPSPLSPPGFSIPYSPPPPGQSSPDSDDGDDSTPSPPARGNGGLKSIAGNLTNKDDAGPMMLVLTTIIATISLILF